MDKSTQPIFADGDHPMVVAAQDSAGDRRRFGSALLWGLAALVIGAIAFAAYVAFRTLHPATPTAERSAASNMNAVPEPTAPDNRTTQRRSESSAPIFPLPSVDPGTLPALANSDGPLADVLGQHFGAANLAGVLYPNDIVRRIVATVDALPSKQVAQRLLPVRSPASPFVAAPGDSDHWQIDSKNDRRYALYVALAEHVDTAKLVETYIKFYPLFQEEYRQLGHSDGNFNDRVVVAIDHLLAAPDVQAPVTLVRPKIMYEFDDPELEQLSAGQKIMVRIGHANAAIIKKKLADIRAAITTAGARR